MDAVNTETRLGTALFDAEQELKMAAEATVLDDIRPRPEFSAGTRRLMVAAKGYRTALAAYKALRKVN